MANAPPIIYTAYYKRQGMFTVRAYAKDDRGFRMAQSVACEENLADASERAVRRIQDDFHNDGLRVPLEVLKTGRCNHVLCDNYSF